MRRRIQITFFVIFFLARLGFAKETALENLPKYEYELKSYISSLTPEQKIGQLLMIGLSSNQLTPQNQALLQELKPGGIILYTHNVQDPFQLQRFTTHLQQQALTAMGLPLFISIDQEGGTVTRIRKYAKVLPSAMAIGATRSPQLSFLSGKMTGLDLSLLGINMNLAPVLDINTNSNNHLIGVRSFGDNPELVSQMGMWYIEGLQSRGVVATAKHFPGHGDTEADSHFVLPTLNDNLADLESFQLLPFQRAIDNGLDAVMTAHIAVPALDSTGLPATLSHHLLTGLIRQRMGFKGVIITDDLEMKAIQKKFTVGEAAVKAILAGADQVMVGWTNDHKREAFQSLLKAHQEGILSELRLHQSLERILKLKFKRGFFDSQRKPASVVTKLLNHPSHQELASQISDQAVSVIKMDSQTLPLEQDDKRHVKLIAPLKGFYQALSYYHGNTSFQKMSYRPTILEMKEMVAAVRAEEKTIDLIVVGLTHHSQIALVNQLASTLKLPVAVISFGSPFYFRQIDHRVGTFVCSYGTEPELLQSTAKVLVGLIRAKGKLPVALHPGPSVQSTIVKAEK